MSKVINSIASHTAKVSSIILSHRANSQHRSDKLNTILSDDILNSCEPPSIRERGTVPGDLGQWGGVEITGEGDILSWLSELIVCTVGQQLDISYRGECMGEMG